ncbi:hypothetical protein [Nonomuraea bangladeshensis]|uniref:hypothetical protein n=1 Tax=Nonomuraea bangladeshensis TaxID=404385 RepID=UPI0031E250FD
MKTPALPMSERSAVSIEEIAERLRQHLDDDPTYASYVTRPDTPLFPWCWPEDVETRMPPAGVPGYSGRLLLPDVDELEVRFWITSPQAAGRAVAAARRGTGECSGEDALKSVTDFDRWGWRGMQTLTTTENWTEDGDSGARGTVVAARGGLLAEVSWGWPFAAGGEPDLRPLNQGVALAGSVLAAVGGVSARPVPAPTARTASVVVAAALPPPAAYGKEMAVWPLPGDTPGSHERVCADPFHEQIAYAGAPAAIRRLDGEVSVAEGVLFLPDEQSAEQARSELLGWSGWCSSDDAELIYSVNPGLEPFTRGPWTGEIRTFAVRRPDPPSGLKGALRRSVAHVALGMRHGTTMVYLRWQGPVGDDPAAALRTGRAALIRTLDRLPASG